MVAVTAASSIAIVVRYSVGNALSVEESGGRSWKKERSSKWIRSWKKCSSCNRIVL